MCVSIVIKTIMKTFQTFKSKFVSVIRLSVSLAKANFKLRNEGSYLGIFWYLLEPLSFFVILLFIRDAISVQSVEHYPIYLFLGLIMFNFFNAVTGFSTKVIQNNAGFIKSLRIDKEAFVVSGALQFTFSHFFEFLILIAFSVFFSINPIWIFSYFLIFIFFFLFTLGISFMISIIGVYMNDFKNIWSVATRLLWFITPIFYTVQNGGTLQTINFFNPLYHFINISRDLIVFNRIPDVTAIIYIVILSIGTFLLGLYIFEKNKDTLAEKI